LIFVLDGSNIGYEYGSLAGVYEENMFSIVGIDLVIKTLTEMGRLLSMEFKFKVILPYFRQGNNGTIKIPESERELQKEMEENGIIRYTPGRRYVKYDSGCTIREDADDDVVILNYASQGGIPKVSFTLSIDV